MRKLLNFLAGIAVVTFVGCAHKGAELKASGDEPKGDVSTYLQGAYMSADDAKVKLTDGGFEIVATFESVKGGNVVIFTCPSLKKEAAKPNRANIAVMKLYIDDESKTISLTNPVYFGKAYMQNDYNHATFSAIGAKLAKVFPNLTPSKDKMEFEDLADYHFTLGMPYYQDVEVLGEGTNADLIAKLKEYQKGKALVYELKISDDTTLVGYEIGRGTKRFVSKIGRQNAGLLPWPIVVSGGKATMLKAEYYIAMNYPLLGMGQFAGIASIPGDIIKDLNKPFK